MLDGGGFLIGRTVIKCFPFIQEQNKINFKTIKNYSFTVTCVNELISSSIYR
jgi:hypothetical protein